MVKTGGMASDVRLLSESKRSVGLNSCDKKEERQYFLKDSLTEFVLPNIPPNLLQQTSMIIKISGRCIYAKTALCLLF